MTLVYSSRKQVPTMWKFIDYSERHSKQNVFEGNGGYRLQCPDIVREISSGERDPFEITVMEYRQKTAEHFDKMSMIYNQMKNHPNVYHQLYMQVYDNEFNLYPKGFEQPAMVAHYHYSNMLYDQLLLQKIDGCLEAGYINGTDKIVDAQPTIEANLMHIGDIVWDDLEVYDYLSSVSKTVYSDYLDYKYSSQTFRYKDFNMKVADHNANILSIVNDNIASLEPYQLQPGESYNEVKRMYNRKYYDILEEPVVSKELLKDKVQINKRYRMALDGVLNNEGVRYSEPSL